MPPPQALPKTQCHGFAHPGLLGSESNFPLEQIRFSRSGHLLCAIRCHGVISRAFSSEVDTGSREENAIQQRSRAFSSEVDTGSREENAIK
jgi:hypothetical protein